MYAFDRRFLARRADPGLCSGSRLQAKWLASAAVVGRASGASAAALARMRVAMRCSTCWFRRSCASYCARQYSGPSPRQRAAAVAAAASRGGTKRDVPWLRLPCWMWCRYGVLLSTSGLEHACAHGPVRTPGDARNVSRCGQAKPLLLAAGLSNPLVAVLVILRSCRARFLQIAHIAIFSTRMPTRAQSSTSSKRGRKQRQPAEARMVPE